MEAKATGDMWVLCLIWSEDQHDVSYTHIKLYFHIRVHPTCTKNCCLHFFPSLFGWFNKEKTESQEKEKSNTFSNA